MCYTFLFLHLFLKLDIYFLAVPRAGIILIATHIAGGKFTLQILDIYVFSCWSHKKDKESQVLVHARKLHSVIQGALQLPSSQSSENI